jgi:type VI secretion system protein ImpG
MTDLHRLFEQEMLALLEEGKSFANDFPEAARFLDRSSLADNDPYVERLIEANAFLVSQIRSVAKEVGDSYSHMALEQFAPELVSPLPSVSVVRFQPTRRLLEPLDVPSRSIVRSKPTAKVPNGVPFQLIHKVRVAPIVVRSAKIVSHENGSGEFTLELVWSSIRELESWPGLVSLFLYGDLPVVWAIYHALTHKVLECSVIRDEIAYPVQVRFQATNTPDYTTQTDFGSPLVGARDFLCADERFRFLDLLGLDQIPQRASHSLKLVFRLKGPVPRSLERAVTAQLFQPNCGVVVNQSTEPLAGMRWDHSQSEIVVRPTGGDHREVLKVLSVEGRELVSSSRTIRYLRYASHARRGSEGVFHSWTADSPKGRRLCYLGLAQPCLDVPLTEQNLAIEAICGDGDLPHSHLDAKSIRVARIGIPDSLAVSGMMRPSPSYRLEGTDRTRSLLLAVSNGHNFGWLDPQRLKDGLQQVLWDPSESKRAMIESIQDVSVHLGHVYLDGVTWRRMDVEIRLRDTTCTPDSWDRLGVLQAFGRVLEGFVRDQTEIGSKYLFRLKVDPAGVVMEFGDKP